MSNEAINWVYDMAERLPVSAFPAGPVSVLVVLGNYADQNGRCFATPWKLAARTRFDERTVRRHLAWCEAHGLLSRQPRWEIGDDNRPHKAAAVDYVLHMEMTGPVGISPSGAITDNLSAIGASEGEVHPESSISPSQPITDNLSAIGEVAPITDNAPRLLRSPVSAISKEEPEEQEIPGLDARAREGAGLDGTGVVEMVSGGPADAARGANRDDFALVRSVLPELVWSRLDSGMVALVAGKARERIEAGWSASDIERIVTSQRWPDQVHSWGHLVAKRIEAIPLDCAPERAAALVDDVAETPGVLPVLPPWHADLMAARERHEPGSGFLNRAGWVKAWLDAHPAEVAAWKQANPSVELPVPHEMPARPAPLERPADDVVMAGELVAA